MRTSRRTLVLIAAALLVLAGGTGAILLSNGNGPEIVLRAADDHEMSYPTTQGLVRMGELLHDWTRGRIEVQVYPSAQLGSEKETIRKTQEGVIDINRVNVNPVTQVEPILKVFSLPYLFRSTDHLHKVVDGPIGKELLAELRDEGLIGLAYYDSGQRSFYTSVRPIRSPKDLEGLRIRVQKAEIMSDVVRSMGGIPIQLAFEEVYTGLQTGVVDGAENNYPSWVTKGHYEIARYYSMDAHVRTPEVILFSRKTWNRLSPEDRRLVREAAEQSVPYQRRLWREKVEEARARAREAGTEMIRVDDIQPFIEATRSVYEQHAEGLRDYVERIRAVR
jgi:tripartite ATP-independent transporter DctP family solute receptor